LVEANAEHRFEDFSGDFAAQRVFWCPSGGVGGDITSAIFLPRGEVDIS
jgi:hypothetical protein